MDNMNMCKCPHHKVMSVLVVLFGLTFLLGAWGTISSDAVNVICPILIIIAGLFKMTKGMCKCCSGGCEC